MNQTPKTFADPTAVPMRFFQTAPSSFAGFGESVFPVSFSFSLLPRTAYFSRGCAVQNGIYIMDSGIYSGPVVQMMGGEIQSAYLLADGKDVRTAGFSLVVARLDDSKLVVPESNVMEIRQPSSGDDIDHLFSIHSTCRTFDPTNYMGTDLYPVATMEMTVHQVLSSGYVDFAPVVVNPSGNTRIRMADNSTWGIVDVEVQVVLYWYTNPSRTVPAPAFPTLDMPRIGIRLYVSEPGYFMEKSSSAESHFTIECAYPTTILRNLGGNLLDVACWGSGSDGNGLFWDLETGIEISNNGLAVQGGSETASYVLENKLDDYAVSSSSSSSTSSRNSSSSISSIIDSSSESSVSTSNSSTLSMSSSSSSLSSLSSSSQSSGSSSSLSSVSSSSPSTYLLDFSTSSSTFLDAEMLMDHKFISPPSVYGIVTDNSGNGRNLTLGSVSGGIGPPTWSSEYGIDGGFLFEADNYHADYLISNSIAWMPARGALALWFKTDTTGNRIGIPFCVSNGFVSSKTEFVVQTDATLGKITAWLTLDGVVQWQASTSNGVFSNNVWTCLLINHNGNRASTYVDGTSAPLAFSTSVDRTPWLASLLSAASPADRMVVGGAPRYYSPFMAIGFSGQLDEITMWNEALSGVEASEWFERAETSSSSSSLVAL